jgi:predicted nucleic acid-binding protein
VPVLDTSAALEVLLKTPLGAAVLPRVLHSDQLLHAPHLLDIEFAHALRRLAQSGAIQQISAEQALTDLADLRLIRHPHGQLVQRIWELRSSVSAYDAAYVALAEALDMPLLTCDAKLSRSHGHRAKIQLLS